MKEITEFRPYIQNNEVILAKRLSIAIRCLESILREENNSIRPGGYLSRTGRMALECLDEIEDDINSSY